MVSWTNLLYLIFFLNSVKVNSIPFIVFPVLVVCVVGGVCVHSPHRSGHRPRSGRGIQSVGGRCQDHLAFLSTARGDQSLAVPAKPVGREL